jgi:uncharacterized glyoxalase superfamily protein PhnB
MATERPTAPGVPPGYTTVTPWIISADTGALIDFAERVFGAEELARIEGPEGDIQHAELRIGDAVVMAFDAPRGHPGAPAFLRLYVADAEATYARALAAGATPVTEPTELFWGDRLARVRDPLGNVWWLQERLEELEPEEMARRAALPDFVEAMRYVRSAELLPSAGRSPRPGT